MTSLLGMTPIDLVEILENGRVWFEPVMEFDASGQDFLDDIYDALRASGLEKFMSKKPSFFLPHQIAELYLNLEEEDDDVVGTLRVHDIQDPTTAIPVLRKIPLKQSLIRSFNLPSEGISLAGYKDDSMLQSGAFLKQTFSTKLNWAYTFRTLLNPAKRF